MTRFQIVNDLFLCSRRVQVQQMAQRVTIRCAYASSCHYETRAIVKDKHPPSYQALVSD